jgi:tRNA modification GTPase
MHDTIAAISTAFGEAAIAIVRMSGPQAIALADSIFRARKPAAELPPRVQQFGSVFDGEQKLDDVLLSVHRAPSSYTGEDVVEISSHGGVLVTRRILESLLARGARTANPGEFTQRAYLNGKIDLTQAEAVMDLIAAQTDLALRAATEQLEGRLGNRIREISEMLVEVLAHVEATIDFPDEDIDPDTVEALVARLQTVRTELQALLASAAHGRVLREGVRTVITGAPNVGKSSLLNLFLGAERAIVSGRPGTTRDIIEEAINLRGIPVRLIDTAGLHESSDELDQQGMARTHRELERADLVLRLYAANEARPAVSLATAAKELVVVNKVDLGEHSTWCGQEGVRISCLTGSGLAQLEDAIVSRMFSGQNARRDWSIAINARHKACLENALNSVDAAQQAMGEALSPEFVAEELRAALDAVGDVVGRVDADEVLGKVFSSFCIGK